VSTIWTPGGERPVGDSGDGPGDGPAGSPGDGDPGDGFGDEPTQEELEAQVDELRRELANSPAYAVIANHCVGLFQLAALHLSLQPPKLSEAQLAIDGLGAIVEGLAGRLGPDEQQLKDGLAQLRIAFVQIKGAAESRDGD
jgi:hypothetical protein